MAESIQPNWYLEEWLASVGVTQADLTRALGWSKAKASDVTTGKQRYNRDLVNEVSAVLNIRPFELLMDPKQAHAMRGLRENAAQIVREPDFEGSQPSAAGGRRASMFRSTDEPPDEPLADPLGDRVRTERAQQDADPKIARIGPRGVGVAAARGAKGTRTK